MTLRSARLLIVGPQGSGKGTQASHISSALGVPSISTGDVFRSNVAAGTDLGKRVQSIMAAGDLVPDDLTSALVRSRLAEKDATRGFLLDGYPRTARQAADLDEMLTVQGTALDAVIVLKVPRQVSIDRILGRAGIEGRSDDREAAMLHRLDLYKSETEPLVAGYRLRGLVDELDGVGEPAAVTASIFAGLRARHLLD